MKIAYAHIRAAVAHRKGTFTIAYTELPKGEFGSVHYALAFCSPRDNFCKARGREIAAGRLACGKNHTVNVQSSRNSDVVQAIIGQLHEKDQISV